MHANSAWTVIAALAHNLGRWTTLIGLPNRPVQTARARRRHLLQIPARLTRTSRRWTLRHARPLALADRLHHRPGRDPRAPRPHLTPSITTTTSQPHRHHGALTPPENAQNVPAGTSATRRPVTITDHQHHTHTHPTSPPTPHTSRRSVDSGLVAVEIGTPRAGTSGKRSRPWPVGRRNRVRGTAVTPSREAGIALTRQESGAEPVGLLATGVQHRVVARLPWSLLRKSRKAVAGNESKVGGTGPPPVCVTPGVVVDCCCSSD